MEIILTTIAVLAAITAIASALAIKSCLRRQVKINEENKLLAKQLEQVRDAERNFS